MPAAHGRRGAQVLALLAALTAVIAAAAGAAPLAAGATTPPRPSTSPATSTGPCAPGQLPTQLNTPAQPTHQTAGPRPSVTALPGGGSGRLACLAPAPVPTPAPVVAPAHVIGGPRLATTDVVTDLPAGVPRPPDNPAVSYVLADMDTGEILAAKNPHAWLLPASTLKTLTALVLMPSLHPDTVVVGAEEDTQADGTKVGITVGGRYPVDDLFNALVMVSANDAAYALARAYGGRDKLLTDMTAKAAELGAFDTVAGDPSGLDAPGQHSSAYDLALFGRAVMALPDFRRRVVQGPVSFPGGLMTPTGTTGPHTPTIGPAYQIQESNQLMPIYPGVIGVKNGFTQAARNTFIGAVRQGNRTLLVTVMGSPEPLTLNLPALLDWGFAYAGRARPVGQLVAAGTAVRPVELGPAGSAPATVAPATDSASGEQQDTTLTVDAVTEPLPQPAATPTPIERVIGSWWSGLPEVARWGLLAAVAVVGLGVALVVRAARRRPRGAYER